MIIGKKGKLGCRKRIKVAVLWPYGRGKKKVAYGKK